MKPAVYWYPPMHLPIWWISFFRLTFFMGFEVWYAEFVQCFISSRPYTAGFMTNELEIKLQLGQVFFLICILSVVV